MKRRLPPTPAVDLEDRAAAGQRLPFDPVDHHTHYRTLDGRWSLHRRRDTGRQATYQWDLIDNADPHPTPIPMHTPALAVALFRARAHIRRHP